MSRLFPVTVAMRTLRRQRLPPRCRVTDDQAVEWLRRCTGQDFGHDVAAWAAWLRANRWAHHRVPAGVGPVADAGPGVATDAGGG